MDYFSLDFFFKLYQVCHILLREVFLDVFFCFTENQIICFQPYFQYEYIHLTLLGWEESILKKINRPKWYRGMFRKSQKMCLFYYIMMYSHKITKLLKQLQQ